MRAGAEASIAATAFEGPLSNPFPGLRSFEPEEEHLFFGRERQVDELLGRLRRTRFLAVVGTSGSGKSSLVRSGLIPSLHSGFMVQAGSSWRTAVFRPGDDPIGNLAAALGRPEVLGDPGEDLAGMSRAILEATLRRSGLGLAECVRQARIPRQENLLVLVDQFEELFRFKRNPRIKDSREEAAAFVRLLLEAARQEEAPVYVVLTMRSDFIGNCTEFAGLAEACNDGQYLVPRMTREERRAAIAGPVAVAGGAISPRLVLRLLNDVGDDPDQLPILQHALMRTWDRWAAHRTAGEPMDLCHYEAVGTMKEALSLHAEEAFRELAPGREQSIAETLFKALTDRGSDSRGIRRPIRLAEVCALAEAAEEEVAVVVERFRRPGRSFLMPPAGVPLSAETVLDISHESLMRIWARLIGWVEEEARSAQIYLRLSRAAAQHQEGSGGLWRDPELALAQKWREEARPTALWAQRYDPAFERAMLFLDSSRRERDLYLERKERERRRQLRRARWLAVVLGAGALVTLVFGLAALVAKIDAQTSAEEARAQRRIAQVRERQAHQQEREARRQKESAEREREKAEQAQRLAEEQRLLAEAERLRAEAEQARAEAEEAEARRRRRQAEEARAATEEQRAIAVAAKDRAEREREKAEVSEREARRLALLQLARALAIQSTRATAAEQREPAALLALAAYRIHQRSGGDPRDANHFDALRLAAGRLDPRLEPVLRHHQDAVRALALAPDGRTLATGGDDGGVRLFDLARPEAAPQVLVPPGGSEVRSLAVDGAARRLAAGSFDGAVRVWDLARPEAPPLRLAGHGGAVYALAFGAGRLASAGADGAVRLWDPAGGAAQELVQGHPHRFISLAFTPDAKRLAAGSAGGGVLVLDLERTGTAPRVLAAGRDVRAVSCGPEGRLAAGAADGKLLVWDLGSGREEPVLEGQAHAAAIHSVAFAARLLATASADGKVKLWPLVRRTAEPFVLAGHAGWVWAVALSADGERVVSGGADRTVRVHWTRAERYAEAVCANVNRNLTRAEWREHLPADVPYEALCPGLPETGEGETAR